MCIYYRIYFISYKEYIPATRSRPGLHSLRNGIGYYKACLKFHTTIDITPDEAHVIGLDEVERLEKEINKVLDLFSIILMLVYIVILL